MQDVFQKHDASPSKLLEKPAMQNLSTLKRFIKEVSQNTDGNYSEWERKDLLGKYSRSMGRRGFQAESERLQKMADRIDL